MKAGGLAGPQVIPALRILLLNQCFHPDLAATAQHATDLALGLARQGHEVTVVAGRKAYGQPNVRYPAEELLEGVRIVRVGTVDFGKGSRWRRALNFGSFLAACGLRLATLGRFDRVVAMTTPPLVSTLGALFASLRGGRLYMWVMDLNPDEAVAAGWLRPHATVTRGLERLLRYGLSRATRVIVLDRFMKERIQDKGVPDSKIVIVPPGARDHKLAYDGEGRRQFRQRWGLTGKFVVMYSGNHSPCHPLDTLLKAAGRLRDDPRFAFCFIGGGSRFEEVRRLAGQKGFGNIVCCSACRGSSWRNVVPGSLFWPTGWNS